MDAFLAAIDFCFDSLVEIMTVFGDNDILGLFILLIIVFLFIDSLIGGKAKR